MHNNNTTQNARPTRVCRYDGRCYRNNPQHFIDFAHPTQYPQTTRDTCETTQGAAVVASIVAPPDTSTTTADTSNNINNNNSNSDNNNMMESEINTNNNRVTTGATAATTTATAREEVVVSVAPERTAPAAAAAPADAINSSINVANTSTEANRREVEEIDVTDSATEATKTATESETESETETASTASAVTSPISDTRTTINMTEALVARQSERAGDGGENTQHNSTLIDAEPALKRARTEGRVDGGGGDHLTGEGDINKQNNNTDNNNSNTNNNSAAVVVYEGLSADGWRELQEEAPSVALVQRLRVCDPDYHCCCGSDEDDEEESDSEEEDGDKNKDIIDNNNEEEGEEEGNKVEEEKQGDNKKQQQQQHCTRRRTPTSLHTPELLAKGADKYLRKSYAGMPFPHGDAACVLLAATNAAAAEQQRQQQQQRHYLLLEKIDDMKSTSPEEGEEEEEAEIQRVLHALAPWTLVGPLELLCREMYHQQKQQQQKQQKQQQQITPHEEGPSVKHRCDDDNAGSTNTNTRNTNNTNSSVCFISEAARWRCARFRHDPPECQTIAVRLPSSSSSSSSNAIRSSSPTESPFDGKNAKHTAKRHSRRLDGGREGETNEEEEGKEGNNDNNDSISYNAEFLEHLCYYRASPEEAPSMVVRATPHNNNNNDNGKNRKSSSSNNDTTHFTIVAATLTDFLLQELPKGGAAHSALVAAAATVSTIFSSSSSSSVSSRTVAYGTRTLAQVRRRHRAASVADTFCGLGAVAPYDDKTELGYRPPSIREGRLRSLLAAWDGQYGARHSGRVPPPRVLAACARAKETSEEEEGSSGGDGCAGGAGGGGNDYNNGSSADNSLATAPPIVSFADVLFAASFSSSPSQCGHADSDDTCRRHNCLDRCKTAIARSSGAGSNHNNSSNVNINNNITQTQTVSPAAETAATAHTHTPAAAAQRRHPPPTLFHQSDKDEIHEQFRYADMANDEGDYGLPLQLGLDFFASVRAACAPLRCLLPAGGAIGGNDCEEEEGEEENGNYKKKEWTEKQRRPTTTTATTTTTIAVATTEAGTDDSVYDHRHYHHRRVSHCGTSEDTLPRTFPKAAAPLSLKEASVSQTLCVAGDPGAEVNPVLWHAFRQLDCAYMLLRRPLYRHVLRAHVPALAGDTSTAEWLRGRHLFKNV